MVWRCCVHSCDALGAVLLEEMPAPPWLPLPAGGTARAAGTARTRKAAAARSVFMDFASWGDIGGRRCACYPGRRTSGLDLARSFVKEFGGGLHESARAATVGQWLSAR